jgi:ubiquinone/menaquinone biosynthesis C-methylase UbiE
MSAGDKVFAGSIPENYDRYMVPLIFAGYARDLAQRAAALSPKAVLELAAGSGVVTRALVPGLSPDARYVVTDLNQPMLDYAATRQNPDNRLSWRNADAQALPFEDTAFDLVCCQFGVMFFPDRPSAYREARRVLKPGGCFLFNTWDRIEDNVFADDVTNALAEFFPNDPPRFLARTPHGYHDTALIRSDLAKAGFSNVTIETRAEQSRAPSPHLVAVAYCQGTPLRNEIEARTNSKPPPNTRHPPSRASTAPARSPPKSRRRSSWRAVRTRRPYRLIEVGSLFAARWGASRVPVLPSSPHGNHDNLITSVVEYRPR